jgi:hypothetical protein
VTGNSNQVARPLATRTYYITASHRRIDRTADEPHELPFGVAHVRTAGGPHTVCGVPALNWPIFWGLTATDPDNLCLECKVVARREENL